MRQIVLEAPRHFSIREVETSGPDIGEVLIKIKKVGVCGSDIHLFRDGRIGEIIVESPFVLGHECMGEVVEVGKDVERGLIGSRVAVEPAIFCGKCRWCKSGNTNVCPDIQFLGLPPTSGALQEYLVHPAHLVEPLPDSISDGAAVVVEPLAVALHAINLMKIRPGQRIVILGTGVIGTCVLSLLRLYKGVRIICVDLLSERLERAKEMGADGVVHVQKDKKNAVDRIVETLEGPGADVVFECAGAKETMWNMCEIAAPEGHIAIIGTTHDDTIAFPSGTSRRKGLTLRCVRRSLNTLSSCIELTEKGLISPDSLVTHTFDLSQIDTAFTTVERYEDGVLKALIDMEKE